MYADQVEAQANRSVRDRLNGNIASDSGRRHSMSGKRQREDDDKWKHDLFVENQPQVSNRNLGVRDLRAKIRRNSVEQADKNIKGSVSGGAKDLREKLSGIMSSRPVESRPHPAWPKPVLGPIKPTRKSVMALEPVPETMVTGSVSEKKGEQKIEAVDKFLHSLGLEKYSVTFQAEEVDMTALLHMREEDLKALGIPMGPRKKMLVALESKSDV